MFASNLALLVNLGALAAYSYSVYYLNSQTVHEGMKKVLPPQLNVYGQFKFLTYQCLLIQTFSTALHVLAHFIKPLRRFRDLFFTALAFPIGSIVVYTFWIIWFMLGREQIFPAKLDPFYPPWLNHITHTIIAPINIFSAILMYHKYTRRAFIITITYLGLYVVLLHVIKAQTGLFVYGYLNSFDNTQRMIYFAGTGVFTYVSYKSGQLLTSLVHGSGGEKQPKQQAQKSRPKQK